MSSLFDIGLSGVSAVKNAMNLTANNIANANNPFYCRRMVNFHEAMPSLFGNGVTLGDVSRISSNFLDSQLIRSYSDLSKSSLLYNNFKSLETLLDNEDTSVSKFINTALNALESLNVTPSSYEGRNYYLDSLKNISKRINSVSQTLNQERVNSQTSLHQKISRVNSLLSKLGELNQKLKTQTPDNQMNLLDQKDELLSSLAELISFQYQDDGFGGVEISLENGVSLLDKAHVATFTTQNDPSTPGAIDVFVENEASRIPVTEILTGGEISGLLDYNNNTLNLLEHKLNRLATALAYTMNHQNQLGIDARGNLGGMIFNDVNDPALAQKRVVAAASNQGIAQMNVTINGSSDLTESDYQLIFDSPNHFNLIRISDGNVVNSGSLNSFPAEISADGFSININNINVVIGDSYFINPTLDFAHQLNITAKEGSQLALGFPVTASANLQNSGQGQFILLRLLIPLIALSLWQNNLTPL
ncbi:hypothetical protein EP47_04865 [Legionella norrlandica]|uniref:Flagellar hook-associated protein 1 n=1 Tax=Legionella norrlandica TaxID=1498499 RepID=A0A0A2SSG6_9GAMM|nr:flagellar hook-associated protein FlgK [Legionella norrlandica]KGP63697.1 hypothetical protein EP47_04865 [Legionella norrlandica]